MKQIIIIVLTFILILWFQSIEDNKYKKQRNNIYEKYKYPIFVSALVGLVMSYSDYFCMNTIQNIPKKLKPNVLEQQIFIDPSPF